MNVRLAAQVMSNTVANAMEHTAGDQVRETVLFIRMMDKFFDIMNIKDVTEWQQKRKDNLRPFTNVGDERFDWLSNEFLQYFQTWREMVNEREGEFTQVDRNKMMLSKQTLDGLEISTRSIVSCVKHMLDIGAEYILTRKFNQDKLEQFFGLLRMKGGANDNPNYYQAGHCINTMRFMHTNQFENIRGNVSADVECHIDDTPLPKRPRKQ